MCGLSEAYDRRSDGCADGAEELLECVDNSGAVGCARLRQTAQSEGRGVAGCQALADAVEYTDRHHHIGTDMAHEDHLQDNFGKDAEKADRDRHPCADRVIEPAGKWVHHRTDQASRQDDAAGEECRFTVGQLEKVWDHKAARQCEELTKEQCREAEGKSRRAQDRKVQEWCLLFVTVAFEEQEHGQREDEQDPDERVSDAPVTDVRERHQKTGEADRQHQETPEVKRFLLDNR